MIQSLETLGPAGELFAQAPVKEYPGVAVETVSDSSRYFVLRIQDDGGETVILCQDEELTHSFNS